MNQPSPGIDVKYDILSPAFFADPYPTLARMRSEDPVYFHPLLHAWVLTRYADIQRVVRDGGGRYSNRKAEQFGHGAPESVQEKLKFFYACVHKMVGFTDPPEHTRLRALISRAFTVQAVERLRPRVQALVDDLLAAARERGEMDAVADFGVPLPLIVFSELMGIPVADGPLLKAYADQLVPLFGAGIADAGIVDAGYQGLMSYYAYFNAHIAERRRRPGEDLLSKLIEAQVDESRLSDDELVAMSVLLFVASHETTTHMLSNAMYTLVRHPEVAQRLREDPRLVDGAVEEMMRWDGPTFATFRRAVVDIDDLGAPIKAGDFVLSVICSANRDPERFADPDRLDIERADNRHLSFSGGIHTCPGAALSRLEGRIAVDSLVRAFSDLQLKSGAVVEWTPHMMIRGVKSLPIALTPNPAAR